MVYANLSFLATFSPSTAIKLCTPAKPALILCSPTAAFN